MKCPECNGASGSEDYFGEWCECPCCDPDGDNDTGDVTPERLAAYKQELIDLDAWVTREVEADRAMDREYGNIYRT
jgi:hypothetical protein